MKSLVALILLGFLLQLHEKPTDARISKPAVWRRNWRGGQGRIVVNQIAHPTQTGVCNDCCVTNGAGYVPHPDCTRYCKCEYDDDDDQTYIRATEHKCFYGLHWNQRRHACDLPRNVQCNTRPTTPEATTTTTTTTTTVPTTTTTTTVPTTTTTTTVPTTTTTTTVPPPTTTKVPTRRHVKGVCDNCLMVNGVGYVQHPDCTRYYQCYYDNNEQTNIVSKERKCPFGLFWNQKILTCDFPENVRCSNDICFDARPKPMRDNCRGYWDCSSQSPVGKCCPARHSFNVLIGQCTPDVSCHDVCRGKDVGAIICQKRAVSDKRQFSQWTTSGWVVMPCPPFTSFNPNSCGCSEVTISEISKTPDCVPEVYLPFDRSTKDQSGKHVYVENNGVKVSNGVAYFDGKGSLRINRFSNSWYGSTVIITVRYKVIDSSSRHALVCNGDCDEHPTLYIGTNPNGVEFYAKTYDSYNPVNFTIPDSTHGYQTATYVLNEMKLRGKIGYQRHSEVAKGNLQTTTKSLTIGACGTSEHFNGYIDEVAIYRCKPSTIINYRI